MIDKVLNEIRQNYTPNPKRWEEIKACEEGLKNHYRSVIEKKKKEGKNIIRFAAFVSNDSMYGMHNVFKLMLKNKDRWDPKVVLIPDISRGYPHQKETYDRTKEYFLKLYGKEYVLDGWDVSSNTFIDRVDSFDIIYFADPYDAMAPEVHTIRYASKKDVLPVYVNYGYDVGYYTMYSRMKGPELNTVWKYFTETVYSFEECKKLQILQGSNVVLTGYAKMDDYVNYSKDMKKTRKKILITSHHSVNMEELPLSNFRTYYELLLNLPKMFPGIDFVFRPHPFMFIRLINEKVWTKDQVISYIEKLKQVRIEYSDGGDYLSLFAECDAIINDCGSFTMEWLFTGKPGCFVLNEDLRDKHLTTQMNEAIKRYRIAKNEADIINFIKDIDEGIISANIEMDEWVRDNIAINYPNAGEKILEEMDIFS